MRAGVAALAALLLAGCQPKETWPSPTPALFEVTSPAGQHGWLFGTIHALPDGVSWRTATLDRTLAQAGTLMVEVGNLADTDAGARAFAAVSQSPGLPPLLQRLPPQQRPALAAALKRAGLDEQQFANTETWAAALAIANAQETGDAANGVDRALLAQRKPVVALESYAGQFAIFDHLAPADQADLLRLATEESSPAKDQHITAAWLAGDTATLERESDDGVLADPELRQALLVDRNRAWIPRISDSLDHGRRPFVAVGAAHLLGSDGLVAQMAARGYRVTRIQ